MSEVELNSVEVRPRRPRSALERLKVVEESVCPRDVCCADSTQVWDQREPGVSVAYRHVALHLLSCSFSGSSVLKSDTSAQQSRISWPASIPASGIC